jgi:pimeloyl-ACP methyl ester carboxylesterase
VTLPDRLASTMSWLPACRLKARRLSASNIAHGTTSTSATTTFSPVSKPSAKGGRAGGPRRLVLRRRRRYKCGRGEPHRRWGRHVASQTYGAEAVGELSPEKSLLLIHGTADRVLPYELSERLYARACEPKERVLYPDDGHGVERHRSAMLEKLHEWSRNLLLGGSETRPGEG